MDAHALWTARDKLSIKPLSLAWATELAVDPDALLEEIVHAILARDFDSLPDGHGFLSATKTHGLMPINSGVLSQVLADAERDGEDIKWFLRQLILSDSLVLHRDAVMLFAERRRLQPPSWWARKPGPRTEQPKAKPSEIVSYLNAVGGGPRTESDWRSLATDHFQSAGKVVRDKDWREAFRQLPAEMKFARGQKGKPGE